MKILLIEDDIVDAEIVKNYFGEVTWVRDLTEIPHFDFDLVLLDLHLLTTQGIETIEKFKELCDLPVIVFSSDDYYRNKLAALDVGINAFLSKDDIKHLREMAEIVLRGNDMEKLKKMIDILREGLE